MSTGQDYEFVEVKVSRKIDIKLSLDDLVAALQQQADQLAASKQQLSSQVADSLNKLDQLVHQMKGGA